MSVFAVMRPTQVERYDEELHPLSRQRVARRKPAAVFTRLGELTTDFEKAKRRAKKHGGRVIDYDGNKVVADYSDQG